MYYLSGEEALEAHYYLCQVAEQALQATCERSRCGTVIVKDGVIIGRWSNTPPGNLESQRRCTCKKRNYHPKVTDKTCCIHAEQRAIMDALHDHSSDLFGSRLYFVRIDDLGEPKKSGAPYCTICSKMTLDAGIAEFVLHHEEGICVYDAEEYNDLSFLFRG